MVRHIEVALTKYKFGGSLRDHKKRARWELALASPSVGGQIKNRARHEVIAPDALADPCAGCAELCAHSTIHGVNRHLVRLSGSIRLDDLRLRNDISLTPTAHDI